ncbi:MAG: hypothetical protein JSW25_02715 [Thermoplasmata archaeon]|nr:MAG: hypothetical protein JSW25_02715 [Thermoplasmata archaeon]
MKQAIIQAGKAERVKKVMRGSLLGYPEQEWRRRARKEQEILQKPNLYIGMMHICLGLFWVFIISMGEGGLDWMAVLLGTLWGGLGAAQIIGYYHLTSKSRNPPAVPGLYEHGIQTPLDIFIPYPEIGKIERKQARLNSMKKRDLIHMRSKFAKNPGSLTDGWLISADFLGTAGMLELKTRLEEDRGIKAGRPDLVVYGRGGAKSRERGMDPIKGSW